MYGLASRAGLCTVFRKVSREGVVHSGNLRENRTQPYTPYTRDDSEVVFSLCAALFVALPDRLA